MYRIKQAMNTRFFQPINQRKLPIGQLVLGLLVIALAAACNGTSDASRVIETENISQKATITYYESLGPMMTSTVDAINQQVNTLQAQVIQSGETIASQRSQLNALSNGSQPPAAAPSNTTSDPSLASIPASVLTTPDASQPTPTAGTSAPSSPNGISIEKVVMAKNKDTNLCAISETTTFALTDKQIIVIGVVHNFKTGVKFSAKWSGPNFDRQDDWTANYDSVKHCVWFYVEPQTVKMAAGSYTVTFIAGEVSAPPLAFTVQ